MTAPQDLRGPIPLRKACRLLGWCDERGKVRIGAMRKLRRLLRTESRRAGPGQRYIWGDCKGSNAWTTMRALNELKLISADQSLVAEVERGIQGIHERIEGLEAKVDVMAEQVMDNTARLSNDERRRSAGYG